MIHPILFVEAPASGGFMDEDSFLSADHERPEQRSRQQRIPYDHIEYATRLMLSRLPLFYQPHPSGKYKGQVRDISNQSQGCYLNNEKRHNGF
jgi:hypothetical protein